MIRRQGQQESLEQKPRALVKRNEKLVEERARVDNKELVEIESYQVGGKARFSKESPKVTKEGRRELHKRPTPNRNFVKKQLLENIELVDQNMEQYYLNFNVLLKDQEDPVSYVIDKNNLFYVERV